MAGLLNSVMTWQDRFSQLADTTAEKAGVKTEEAAHAYLVNLKAAREAQPAATAADPEAVADRWGKTGTTNEGAKPTK